MISTFADSTDGGLAGAAAPLETPAPVAGTAVDVGIAVAFGAAKDSAGDLF
jgi:hypothetical protein